MAQVKKAKDLDVVDELPVDELPEVDEDFVPPELTIELDEEIDGYSSFTLRAQNFSELKMAKLKAAQQCKKDGVDVNFEEYVLAELVQLITKLPRLTIEKLPQPIMAEAGDYLRNFTSARPKSGKK
jgi:hypothetical protein